MVEKPFLENSLCRSSYFVEIWSNPQISSHMMNITSNAALDQKLLHCSLTSLLLKASGDWYWIIETKTERSDRWRRVAGKPPA
jgi:hypothetical protein